MLKFLFTYLYVLSTGYPGDMQTAALWAAAIYFTTFDREGRIALQFDAPPPEFNITAFELFLYNVDTKTNDKSFIIDKVMLYKFCTMLIQKKYQKVL